MPGIFTSRPVSCKATACANSVTERPGQHRQRDTRADAADFQQLAESGALVIGKKA